MPSVFDKYKPVQNTSVFSKYQPVTKAPVQGDYFGKGAVDFLGNTAKGVSNLGANAAATVGEGIGNTASFAGDAMSMLDPVLMLKNSVKTVNGGNAGFLEGYQNPVQMAGKGVQSEMKQLADITRESSAKSMEMEKDNNWAKFGGGLGTVANIIGGAALGGDAGTAAAKAMTGSKALVPIGQKIAQGWLPKAAQFAGESLGSTQGVIATTEGRMAKPEELAAGAVFDVGIAGLGKGLTKLAQFGLEKIPQFTPSVKAALGQKGLTRAGEIMYENVENIPITTSREAIGASLEPLKKKTYSVVTSKIDDAIKAGAGTTTVDDLMDGIKKTIISDKGAARAGMSLDEVPKAVEQIDQMKEFYKKLYGNNPLNLNQVQQLKKNLRYKASAGMDSLITAKNQFKEGTRANAQKFIETEVTKSLGKEAGKALKNANLDYNVIKRLAGTLEKKAPYSGYLTDVISGSAGAAGAIASLDVGEAVKQAAIAVGLKRLATSPMPKVIFAKIMKNASKSKANKFISALAKGLMPKQKIK